MGRKGLRGLLCGLSLLLGIWAYADSDGCRAVQRGIYRHLQFGESALARGEVQLAIAHTRAILMPDLIKLQVAQRPEIVQSAADMWTSALDGDVRFAMASPGDRADIRVEFSRKVFHEGRRVAATVKWKRFVDRELRYRLNATILVAEMDLDGKPLSDAALQSSVAHEIGHLLGLDDGRKGIMSPLGTQAVDLEPSKIELENLKQLRAKALDLQRRCVARIERNRP